MRGKVVLVGKGPSFKRVELSDSYTVIALNTAALETPCNYIHLIDIDVFDKIEMLLFNSDIQIIIPYYPHVNCKATTKTVFELLGDNMVFNQIKEQGRLLLYNLKSSNKIVDGFPVVSKSFFSAEALVKLLVQYPVVGHIHLIGIDGGNKYNRAFDSATLLANGHKSFDIQFTGIQLAILKKNITMSHINYPKPLNIYVGAQPEQWLAVKVLEYSIFKHATIPVKVIPLYEVQRDFKLPKDKSNRPRTPFSFQRFFIPEANEYQGKAVYLDSDMLVFTDVKKLLEFSTTAVINAAQLKDDNNRVPQFSVMIIDCDIAKNWQIEKIVDKLDSGNLNYEQLMFQMEIADTVESTVPYTWNSLELYENGLTNLIHFTDMDQQPWLFKGNKNEDIWVQYLIDAIDDGIIKKSELKKEIIQGNVRPSLWFQVKDKVFNSCKLPKNQSRIDLKYKPKPFNPNWKLNFAYKTTLKFKLK